MSQFVKPHLNWTRASLKCAQNLEKLLQPMISCAVANCFHNNNASSTEQIAHQWKIQVSKWNSCYIQKKVLKKSISNSSYFISFRYTTRISAVFTLHFGLINWNFGSDDWKETNLLINACVPISAVCRVQYKICFFRCQFSSM